MSRVQQPDRMRAAPRRIRRSTVVLAVLALAAATIVPVPGGAEDAAGPMTPPCAGTFFATPVQGDPNAAIVRLSNVLPEATTGGTVTAYGRETAWSGNAESLAVVRSGWTYGASFVLRAAGPIEAVTYAPASGACIFRAGVRSRSGYEAPDGATPPVVSVGNPRHLEPWACARPYADAVVLRAVEPMTPQIAEQQGIKGSVVVWVTLDERGTVMSTRIWSSPSAVLNRAALDAARSSTYSRAVFRCTPVRSTYMFTAAFP